MKEQRYFSYDPEDGFSFHETAEQAETACKKSFEYYEEAAADGWPENTCDVCWGEIRGRSTLTEEIHRPPQDQINEDGYDESGTYWDVDSNSLQRWEIKPIDSAEEKR